MKFRYSCVIKFSACFVAEKCPNEPVPANWKIMDHDSDDESVFRPIKKFKIGSPGNDIKTEMVDPFLSTLMYCYS